MKKRLVIELSEEATENYLKWSAAKVEAEVDEDCEPSGSIISICIGPAHYGSEAFGYTGQRLVEFGDAEAKLIDIKE